MMHHIMERTKAKTSVKTSDMRVLIWMRVFSSEYDRNGRHAGTEKWVVKYTCASILYIHGLRSMPDPYVCLLYMFYRFLCLLLYICIHLFRLLFSIDIIIMTVMISIYIMRAHSENPLIPFTVWMMNKNGKTDDHSICVCECVTAAIQR